MTNGSWQSRIWIPREQRLPKHGPTSVDCRFTRCYYCVAARDLRGALPQPNQNSSPYRDHTKQKESCINRREKPDPFPERHAARRENRHQRSVGRHEDVSQSTALLIREHSHLPPKSEQIRQRHQHRHRQHRLPAHARHREMDEELNDHHPHRRDGHRQMRQRSK